MTFILLYGSDGCGKSVQSKSIAETNDLSEHWSFAVKNRKLYETSGVNSVELLRFNEDSTVNPYKTIDALKDEITKLIKANTCKLLVIDEITLLRKWAQAVVIESINKSRRGTTKPMLTKIGEENYGAWEQVNNIVNGSLERIAVWSEVNSAIVIAITADKDVYTKYTDAENNIHSTKSGRMIADAHRDIRKLADIIIKLEKDGSKGRGYYAFFEKQQDWMNPGADAVKVDKNGVLTELMLRGVIE